MKILMIVLWMVAGEPKGADTFGFAVSKDACTRELAEALFANQDRVVKLIEAGAEPVLVCVDLTGKLPGDAAKGPITKL